MIYKLSILMSGLSLMAGPGAIAGTSSYTCQAPLNLITERNSATFKLQIQDGKVNLIHTSSGRDEWFSNYGVNQSVGTGKIENASRNPNQVSGDFFSALLKEHGWDEVILVLDNSILHGADRGRAVFWTMPHDEAAGDPDVRHPQSQGYSLDCVKGRARALIADPALMFATGEMLSLQRRQTQSISKIKVTTVYDLSSDQVNWNSGYTTLFIGLKKRTLSSTDFLKRLTAHVRDVHETFKDRGFNGYIFVSTPDYEIAWLNWSSKALSDEAFQTAEGKKIAQDAQSFMDTGFYKQMDWATKSPANPASL